MSFFTLGEGNSIILIQKYFRESQSIVFVKPCISPGSLTESCIYIVVLGQSFHLFAS